MIHFFKNLFVRHLEKIIFLLLLFFLGGTLAHCTLSYIKMMRAAEPVVHLREISQSNVSLESPSQGEYETLVKLIQTIPDAPQEKNRNIFVRKAEEAFVKSDLEPQKTDTDHDGMPNEWEIRYGLDPANPSDAQTDLDRDNYSNLDEYIGGSDPADSNSFPGAIKLRIIKIYRRSIQVNFFGYIQLPDESYQVQINWAGRTFFLKVGQKIRGFTISEFTPSIELKYNAAIGAEQQTDSSFIKIQKANESPITLVIGKPSFEKEPYASIKDMITRKIYSVHAGSKIKGYKVLDITSSKVVISRNKKIYTLQHGVTE